MGRQSWRLRLLVVGPALALLGLSGWALGAEEPSPTPSSFVGWLENPVPQGLPFRLSGDVDLNVKGLQGQRDSPNFHTYRVIENGFVANRFHLNLETNDQRRFIDFQGLDIHKDDQNYQVSAGEYGRYRLDFEWDQIPHLYGKGQTPFVRSADGVYTLPPGVAGLPMDTLTAVFNTSPSVVLKTRNDTGRVGLWWAPTSEWDVQLTYERTRREGTRPLGAGFSVREAGNVELPEPIEWQTEQVDAIIGYSTQIWQLQGGYRLSLFNNTIKAMTFDNPLFTGAACPDVACASQGRTTLAPDNQAHNLYLTGGLNLSMATRLTIKVAYGINRQNDTFFRQTINDAAFALDPAGLQLPAASLRGDVRTLLINAKAITRPIRNVTVTAIYRFYNKDNRTDVLTFGDNAVRDTDLTTGTGDFRQFSRIFDYQKQNGDLDVAWMAFRGVTLKGGFGWERWDRPDTREVGRTDEYSGKFGLSYRPLTWLDVMAKYTRSWKRIGQYNPFASLERSLLPADFAAEVPFFDVPLLRKFDEADRDRHKAEGTIRLTPMKDLDVGVSLAFARDHFPFSGLGLQEDWNWSAGTDIRYTPVSWLTLRANYEREEYHSRQRGRHLPEDPVTGIPGDFVDHDWISRDLDTFDSVGAGALVRLIPDRLDLTVNYAFQRSLARVSSSNPTTPVSTTPNCGAGTDPEHTCAGQVAFAQVTSFPDDKTSLHSISGLLRYRLLKNLALRLGYTYERFRTLHWQTDFLRPFPTVGQTGVGASIFLGVKPFQNYEAHIIWSGISYGF